MTEPLFGQICTASDLAEVVVARRSALAERERELGGVEMMRAYSDLTDALVRRVYELALGECSGAQVAVAAVGGYGRREMSPFSDIDVAFIASGDSDDETDKVVKRAFRLLMDVAEMSGLSVGYSYRCEGDVGNLPLDTQTALLDARCVAGNRGVFDSFRAELRRTIVPAAFVAGHTDARRASETPLVVEPDVKEGGGGLRDLHTARWLAQVAMNLDGDAIWNGLRARGILLDSELDRISKATELIARTRNALHLLAGRALDILGASRHAQVAERLGFDGAQEFLSVYYQHAHDLRQVYRKIASACLEASLEIEPGIVARDGRLQILDRGLLCRDSAAPVRVFGHAQLYHLAVSRESADMISAAASEWEPSAEAGHSFVGILSHPGAAAALRSMAELGVLQVIIPQFGALMNLVPADAAHRFTVGEHTLQAVEQLEALLYEPDERFAEVQSRVQDIEVLFVATLLHDIGKLDSKREHAKTGAFRASKVASRLGMPDEACAKVEFLVRRHLRMAEVARLRDLHQPKTIRDFVAVVKDQQLLDMLLLLTVADYRAVGARHWSQVQIRFLLELHERAYAALRSPGAQPPDIDRHRTRVRRELSLANLPSGEVDEHCTSMPASYLLNTPPEDLAAHIGYVRSVREGLSVAELKDDRAGHFTLLTVVATDRPGLLSQIAGVLHALGVDIHAAQVFTRSSADHIAIDTLYVDFEGRQLTEMRKRQLEVDLLSVLSGERGVEEMLAHRRRSSPNEYGAVVARELANLSDHHTVIEVRALDRPGLLYYLTAKIAELGWSIHSARVATWGHEARDVFYVTDASGGILDAGEVARLRVALAGEASPLPPASA